MSKLRIGRFISVLVGAAVLFGLQRGLGLQLYLAIPIATIAYMAVKVAIGLAWGVDEKA
jgi:hypothetical protein